MAISRREFLAAASIGVATVVTFPDLLYGRVKAARSSPAGMTFELVEPFSFRILVLGIGTAGVEVLDALSAAPPGVERVAIHTDARELRGSAVDRTLVIGRGTTSGLGCVGRAVDVRRAAQAHREDIEQLVRGADLVCIVGGLGGSTFNGVAPVVAEGARAAENLTVAVASKPFHFEGRARNRRANAVLAELTAHTDSTIVIPNDRIIDVTGTGVSLQRAFEVSVRASAAAVRAIATMITVPGMVNAGFADLRAVVQGGGIGAVGIGEGWGEDRAVLAARQTLACPLLKDVDLGRATGALFQATGDHLTLAEVEQVSAILYDALGDDTAMIFFDSQAPELGGGLRVTLITVGGVVV